MELNCYHSILILLLYFNGAWSQRMPIDDYVARPDDSYTYEEIYSETLDGYTMYIVNMTSLTWFNVSVSTRPLWYHYLTIHIPDNVLVADASFLYLSYDSNTDDPPNATSEHVYQTGQMAVSAGVVTAVLRQCPNQPISFYDTPDIERYEDDIIAWTWRVYGDELLDNRTSFGTEILLRFPMAKAAVRAMDTVDTFVRGKKPGNPSVKRFMVAGESKRGWTTWITAAVDNRVVAHADVVLSGINVIPNFHKHYRALGGWSFALIDYWNEGLMGRLDTPEAAELFYQIDPYTYRNRYTMPTLVVMGASDELFMIDDTHYFFDDLPGPEKFVWIMYNTSHSITNSPIMPIYWQNLETFFTITLSGADFPEVFWQRNETETHGSIWTRTNTDPIAVSAYVADTPDPSRRDFRRVTGFPPVAREVPWLEFPVEELGGNEFYIEFEKPSEGWRAFFIQFTFSAPGGRQLQVTTEANVIPDVFPYPQCHGYDECQGNLV